MCDTIISMLAHLKCNKIIFLLIVPSTVCSLYFVFRSSSIATTSSHYDEGSSDGCELGHFARSIVVSKPCETSFLWKTRSTNLQKTTSSCNGWYTGRYYTSSICSFTEKIQKASLWRNFGMK